LLQEIFGFESWSGSNSMPWWAWALIIWLALGATGAVMKVRSGQMDLYYSDGCRRPFLDRAFRVGGAGDRILPRPGDGEINDLEHLVDDRHRHTS
jgi:hypothetical protein